MPSRTRPLENGNLAGTAMTNIRELLKKIGILPHEGSTGEHQEEHLQELRTTERRQEQKLSFAEHQLDKVKRNQISEKEFWRLLEIWPQDDEDSDSNGPH